MEYLVMRLYGPMASWGDIAIGESRHSHYGPTKAAVMGLVAATLGLKREQEAQHLALNRGYQLATEVQAGQLLRDYHTVQAPDKVGKFQYRTRRDELILGRDRLGTVLSTREYRTDACALVALKASDNAPYSLQQLMDAITRPVFVPYLGRKACVLAAPMEPQLIQAKGVADAFRQYQPLVALNLPRDTHARDYFWEGKLQDYAAEGDWGSQVMQLVLHDQLRCRQRWQFEPRCVYHLHLSEES